MNQFPNDDQIRRIIRDIRRLNLHVATQFAPLARQIQELQQSPAMAEMRRSLERLNEAVVPRLPEIRRMIDSINTEQTRMLVAGVAEFAKAARELRERAFPPNWSDFDEDEIESIVALMEQTGWSLVWVPRAEVVRKLIDAPGDAREQVLADSADQIVDDLDVAVFQIKHTHLSELRDELAQAIGAFRAGFPGPAQSYATAVFTTTMHVHLGLKKFPAARKEFTKRDPMDVEIMVFKLAAIYRTAGRAIETYLGNEGEPIPTSFNRHASTHRVSKAQYTTANALAALLLATSLLRELEPLFQLQFPEHNGSASAS